MSARSIVFLGLAWLILLVGCSVRVGVNQKSETDMGSHHVVVKPGSTFTTSASSSGDGDETYEYSCGEVSITIRNEELLVNNVKYGKLNAGDPILVDNGKVFVADVDAHSLHAFDVSTGNPLWEFVSGGRIDSPPTCHRTSL